MPKHFDKEEAQFIAGLQQEIGATAGYIWNRAEELVTIARSLHRCNERECNESMDDATRARFDKRVARLEARATEIATEMGVGVEFNGDPRGITIILKLPSGRTNDWGQRGWCV